MPENLALKFDTYTEAAKRTCPCDDFDVHKGEICGRDSLRHRNDGLCGWCSRPGHLMMP